MRPEIRKAVCWIALSVIYWIAPSKICIGRSFTWQDSTAKVIEIRVDPITAVGGLSTDLFDSIQYVPLETNEQSAFSTITQLEVTDKYYIILDESLNTFFFFNHNGNFSHKIDKNNKNAPFGRPTRFSLDRSKNILEFEESQRPYNTYTFKVGGDFINVEKEASFQDFALFNGFKVGYRIDDNCDSSHFASILKYDATTDQLLGSYLPVDTVRKNRGQLPSGSSKNFHQSDAGPILFTQSYDYNIYALDSLAVPNERYRMVLPLQNTIPADFLTNPKYYGKWNDILRGDRRLIYSINDVYVSGDWLIFYTSPSIKRSAFLYNLATQELFNLKETKDSGLGLPITENSRPVLGIVKGALISDIPFVTLKKLHEEMPKSKKEGLPQQLRELMKKGSHNPILRLSYLKR